MTWYIYLLISLAGFSLYAFSFRQVFRYRGGYQGGADGFSWYCEHVGSGELLFDLFMAAFLTLYLTPFIVPLILGKKMFSLINFTSSEQVARFIGGTRAERKALTQKRLGGTH